MGPLCTPAVVARTQAHVDDAVAQGATLVLGGRHEGQFFEPTVITGVTSAMRIAREETFGPVAPIMAFDTLDEALAIANETEFGLTAAVFTRSLQDAWRAAEELRHGTVHINETTNYWTRWRRSAGPRSPVPAASSPAGSSTPSPRPSRSRSIWAERPGRARNCSCTCTHRPLG